MAYIYKITNQINNKIYIGKTEYFPPDRRWKQHIIESKKERSNHRALYAAMNKYGIENFIFEILEETNNPNEREQYYIQEYNSYHYGYNETLGGDGASYLELPEQEICKEYIKEQNLSKVVKKFGYDIRTIKKVLYKYGIEIISSGEVTKKIASKPVAQLNKKTEEIIAIFPSAIEAERQLHLSSHVADVCTGKRKTTGGFKWKYVQDL